MRGRAGSRPPLARPPAPYWLRLPAWLCRGYRRQGLGDRLRGGTLGRILKAQHGVFLFVRLQDDLFDGQAGDPRRIYEADAHLLASRRSLGRLFAPGHRFWDEYWAALDLTTRAIVRVDRLQRRRGRMDGGALREYARVGAILRLGATAVCLLAGRRTDIPAVHGFCDGMAIAGQIADDWEDVEEDRARGRHNYAANIISRHPRDPWGAVRVIAGEMRRRLELAVRSIEPLGLDAATRHVSGLIGRLDRIEARLHRHEAGSFLGRFL